MKKRIIVGISGASGAPLAYDFLKSLRAFPDFEVHLIISESARKTIRQETDFSEADYQALCDFYYDFQDITAPIASGTFHTYGMVILPCSMRSLGGLANGYCDNLLLRAADVALKERRKLILVPRETPLHEIHLSNMIRLSRAGVMIIPPMLTYYNKGADLAGVTHLISEKILRTLGIEGENFYQWRSINCSDENEGG